MDKLSDLAAKLAPFLRQPKWIYPDSPEWVGSRGLPLTSTSWDGDTIVTAGKTLINLNSVFGLPIGVRAVLLHCRLNDTSSAGASFAGIRFSPNAVPLSYVGAANAGGRANGAWDVMCAKIPCNQEGNIYYQSTAIGTMVAYVEVHGYEK